ncbi:hypothetical protein SSAmo_0980 [Enterobacterales bacterium endosymbiont of Anomoneura mori]|uniref:DNA-directed RNA polymerase subunit omega n=1 Tax=Enterobacterales bacterium endosymbiont of Anomoneura mori TaxID=3132096 RepID=UPI00399C926F
MSYNISEKIIYKIGNRFDLVIIAAHRARQIQLGIKLSLIKKKNEKYFITALKEIEMGFVTKKILKNIYK